MLVAFPFLAIALLYLAAFRRVRDWRSALLIAATCWGILVTMITELLSLFTAISAVPLGIAWIVVCLLAAVWIMVDWKRAPSGVGIGTPRDPNDWRLITIWALLYLLVALLGVIAVTAAPNSYDGLVYHMPRVMHWLQNGHVGHYPTSIQRQVYLGPWSGYAVLQFQALLDNDYLANGVQWFSLLVSMTGVSLIARRLGAGIFGQTTAAALTATIPMAILQAASPLSDLVVTAWIVSFVWFILESLKTDERQDRRAALMTLAGLCLGLAILTKATAYFFGFAFCLWLMIGLFRAAGWRQTIVLAAIFGGMVLLPNIPNFVRQARTYGSPLGPTEEAGDPGQQASPYGNAIHTPGAILSNAVRDAMLELQTPWAKPNQLLESAAIAIHRWIGMDPADPRTTWPDLQLKTFTDAWQSDNFSGNPLHFLIATVAVMAGLAAWRTRNWQISSYAAAILCGFVIFCAMLSWNYWLTRLLLPLMVLSMPLAGQLFARPCRGWLAFGVVIVALGLSVPIVATSISHPLVGPEAYYRNPRLVQYYYTWAGDYGFRIQQSILDSAAKEKFSSLGIRVGHDDTEYALWMALRARGLRPRIEHIDVTNPTRKYESTPPFDPDLSIVHNFDTKTISLVPRGGPKN